MLRNNRSLVIHLFCTCWAQLRLMLNQIYNCFTSDRLWRYEILVQTAADVGLTLPLVVTVKVDEPEPVRAAGFKLAEVREGAPLTLRLTFPVNPPELVTVTVYVVPEPRLTVREAGEALMEKSPLLAALTTNVAVVEWTKAPLVPVIVTV